MLRDSKTATPQTNEEFIRLLKEIFASSKEDADQFIKKLRTDSKPLDPSVSAVFMQALKKEGVTLDQIVDNVSSRDYQLLNDYSDEKGTNQPSVLYQLVSRGLDPVILLCAFIEKISADPHQLAVAQNTTSHLWFNDPFTDEKKTPWIHKLFMTHPPVEDRIKALRGMKV